MEADPETLLDEIACTTTASRHSLELSHDIPTAFTVFDVLRDIPKRS
tara:strand:- start:914 stop:1054 length:141 start_codon:yes stop_codon:yes gene_type:complete